MGTYTLVETAAGDGYVFEAVNYTVTVDEFGNVTITDSDGNSLDTTKAITSDITIYALWGVSGSTN